MRAEIYFLDGARAMVETGDLVVPHYRGAPFFDKPALTYWLVAAAFRVFGPTPAAGRLVSALAAIAAVLATVALARTRRDRRAALLAGLTLATTNAFVSFGRLAMSDMLMTLLSTSAVALALAPVASARGALLRAAGVGAILGGAFMTKGPIAVLFPVVGLVALGWAEGRRRLDPRALVAAAAGFLLVGLPWFVAVTLRLGTWPLAYFFLHENLERFAGATYDAQRPFWYYLPTYLLLGLPWSVFLPLAGWRAWRARDAFAQGLLMWAAIMIVPLSLSRGKVDYYILPLVPGLSIVIGGFLAREDWGVRERGFVRAVLIALGILLLALVAAPWVLPEAWRPPLPITVGAGIGLAVVAVALLAAARRATPRAAVGAVTLGSAAAHLVAIAWLVPAFVNAQPNARILADVSRERAYRPAASFAFCSDPTRVARDVLFHERLAGLDTCGELWAAASGKLPYLLLVNENERASLGQIEYVREVGDYDYLAPTALSAISAWSRPKPARLYLIANFETDEPVAMERWRKERKRALKALEEGR
jgi:4-amino-4-deoxy-L-arabinose transferase-like glycosyltransferase